MVLPDSNKLTNSIKHTLTNYALLDVFLCIFAD